MVGWTVGPETELYALAGIALASVFYGGYLLGRRRTKPRRDFEQWLTDTFPRPRLVHSRRFRDEHETESIG